MKTPLARALRFNPPKRAAFRLANVISVTLPLASVIGNFCAAVTVVTVVWAVNFLVCFVIDVIAKS